MEYQGKIRLENYKLTTVCQHFGISLDAHDAANDITATREVIKLLMKDQEALQVPVQSNLF